MMKHCIILFLLLLLFFSRQLSGFTSRLHRIGGGSNSVYRSICMKQVVIFGPHCMRVHDNPMLIAAATETATKGPVLPVYIHDPSYEHDVPMTALQALRQSINTAGGDLLELHGDAVDVLQELLQTEELKRAINSVIAMAPSPYDPFIKSTTRVKDWIEQLDCFSLLLKDELFEKNPSVKSFREYKTRYNRLSSVALPTMNPDVEFLGAVEQLRQELASVSKVSAGAEEEVCGGEALGLKYLNEYVLLGENEFSKKYEGDYITAMSNSEEHRLSLLRLAAINCKRSYGNFFQGEVLSGLLSPLLLHGCVSPRLLVHCRRTLIPGFRGWGLQRPLQCRLRTEAVRKDWHTFLSSTGEQDQDQSIWQFRFSSYKGYAQRTASTAPIDSKLSNIEKPLMILIHGFGGSIMQFSSLAAHLKEDFDVHALDSLGFGFSEKGPLSYNQYLWRDQVISYIDAIMKSRKISGGTSEKQHVYLVGNSIGGFTASSVAAELERRGRSGENNDVHCAGLVLCNPSGQVLNNTGISLSSDTSSFHVSTESGESNDSDVAVDLNIIKNYEENFEASSVDPSRFPAYNGPSPEALRLFGRTVFSLLQPRITATCEWLYPSRPEVVKSSGLDANILRDSCDPGAADVIAAGGKLPQPRTVNDLFGEYTGPVLMSQGALDPLNDAPARAYAYQTVRENVEVDLLPLGHCPMDEDGAVVARSILRWYEKLSSATKQQMASVSSGKE